MKNKKQLLKNWIQNGYVNIPIFSKKEVLEMKKEAMAFLIGFILKGTYLFAGNDGLRDKAVDV